MFNSEKSIYEFKIEIDEKGKNRFYFFEYQFKKDYDQNQGCLKLINGRSFNLLVNKKNIEDVLYSDPYFFFDYLKKYNLLMTYEGLKVFFERIAKPEIFEPKSLKARIFWQVLTTLGPRGILMVLLAGGIGAYSFIKSKFFSKPINLWAKLYIQGIRSWKRNVSK